MIQEHHARSHHFDLRLEMDGVLVSWAVPKGMPEQASEKRLAVHVEDHPLDYAEFAGEIPKGHYGAGRVEIWDRGRWEPVDASWRRGFERGKLKFRLTGDRLDGDYLLARMEEPNWLLRRLPAAGVAADDGAEEEPGFVEPQLAKVVSNVPAGPEWVHEIKLDGYRLIAVRRDGEVRLFTRSGLDWTERFGPLAGEIAALPGGDVVLDGEAVCFDPKGRSSFGMLQEALKEGRGEDIVFVVFDILHEDGRSLRRLPLAERMKRLDAVVPPEGETVRRSKQWTAEEGADLFRQACELGLEGILSKRADGRYLPGQRQAWVKSKCRPRQEFVICGFTDPQGSRSHFGSLVLGTIEDGRLVPRGKVGTGFNERKRGAILGELEKLRIDRPHFPEMKDVHWVEPVLVAEVEFAELTRTGSVRQAAFVGLRADKPAADVRLESAAPAGEPVVAGIRITHPDRVVFPRPGVTKLEVARFFESVSEWMLPHVVNRPLALLRAPDGASGQTFFQKSFRTGLPAHVRQSGLDDGSQVLSIRSVEGLVSLAQHGVLEIHPWGSPLDRPEKPDLLIWDLDPAADVSWKSVLGAAFLIRDFLHDMSLRTWVKTSGGKGLHVMLPVRRRHTWDVLKPFAREVARAIAAMNPGRFTIRSGKEHRKGRIYIDWMRNGRGATCIAPWCPRARPGAPVSMPLDWDDLPDAEPASFTLRGTLPEPGEWLGWKPQPLPVAVVRRIVGGG